MNSGYEKNAITSFQWKIQTEKIEYCFLY